jgi:hypothetical protein
MTLPDPPLGPEVDCTDLDSFMLNVERLLGSELVAVSSHEVLGAALLLWCRAWKQRPAASLPDDDEVLAGFAHMPLKRFKRLREKVLHGFVKCSDGRLYHPVLAADAITAFQRKLKHREKVAQETNRKKRWREAQKPQKASPRPEDVPRRETPYTGTGTGTGTKSPNGINETFFSRKGVQGEGGSADASPGLPRGKPAKKASPHKRLPIPDGWKPGDEERQAAIGRTGWSEAECDAAAEAFRLHHTAKGTLFSDLGAAWQAWVAVAAAHGRRRPRSPPGLEEDGGGYDRAEQPFAYAAESREHWHDRCAVWFDRTRGGPLRRRWPEGWGPAPGETGCRVPADVLAEFEGQRE